MVALLCVCINVQCLMPNANERWRFALYVDSVPVSYTTPNPPNQPTNHMRIWYVYTLPDDGWCVCYYTRLLCLQHFASSLSTRYCSLSSTTAKFRICEPKSTKWRVNCVAARYFVCWQRITTWTCDMLIIPLHSLSTAALKFAAAKTSSLPHRWQGESTKQSVRRSLWRNASETLTIRVSPKGTKLGAPHHIKKHKCTRNDIRREMGSRKT